MQLKLQFNKVNNKELLHSPSSQQFRHFAYLLEFDVLVDRSMAYIQEEFFWQFCGGSSIIRPGSSVPSHHFPSLFPLFQQCDRCLCPLTVWGLVAGLPGFASHMHGSGLHLGAGYQWWKLLGDVSGTQPPF